MEQELINDKPYTELKSHAREVLRGLKDGQFKWTAEPSEDHIVLLWRGLYKNQPEYIDDGDFWITDSKEEFWDFLEID